MIYSSLYNWVESSNSNWNALLLFGLFILAFSVILILYYQKKIGKSDERTAVIYLRSLFAILISLTILDIVLPKGDMWEIIYIYKYGLSFGVCGVYLSIQYHKGI